MAFPSDGEIVGVRAEGRFWRKDGWREFVEGVRARRRWTRAREQAMAQGHEPPTEPPPPEQLRFVATLSAAAPA